MLNCLFSLSEAQVTRVSGKVTDALTNEPIPFVAAVFKGTTDGDNTDFNGAYSISTLKASDSVVFTCVGYKRVAMPVKRGRTVEINVIMKVNKIEFGEVVVKAGRNPADILFEKIIDHKDENNKRELDSYQYEVYNKVEFDLANISEKFKTNRLIKPFAFIFDKIDSSETNEKPFLPIFISENLSDYYFRNSPKQKKEIIKASKVSGLENTSVTQFMGDMYQDVNVYSNFINVFGKSFISPISSMGQLYYHYFLTDSAFIGKYWCYKMKFKPRRKQELTFIGDFWVHDTTYAVKKLQMRIVDDANINFIQDLAIVQEFDRINDKNWMPTVDKFVMEFAPMKSQEGMSFIGRKSTSYKNFIINQPINDSIFSGTENVVVLDNAMKKSADFWNSARHDSLSPRETGIYAMVDTIKTLPAYKTYVDIITLFFTGYKDLGLIELGTYYNFFSFNSVEGARFRLSARTSDEFSNRIKLNGYVAYGIKDMRFKYSAGIEYYLNKKPREFFGFQYKEDIEQLGQSDNAFRDDNLLSSLFRRSPSNKLTETVIRKIYYEKEWFAGLSNRITLTNTNLDPLGALSYSYFTDEEHVQSSENIVQSEVSLYTRFLLHEKFIEGKKGRVSVGSKYPLIQTNISFGVKDLFKSNFDYVRADLKISDRIKTQPFGYGYYSIQLGKMWGQVPYPLLFVHPGNETYFYDYGAFNMMNYYEFVSDIFGSFHYVQHFEGFFLDKIPLMRKLKWREVAQLNAVSGALSKQNREILVNPNVFSDLTKPYAEAGVGVENILKIFRFDFLWRMTYIDKEYRELYKERFAASSAPARFGIRGSLQITF